MVTRKALSQILLFAFVCLLLGSFFPRGTTAETSWRRPGCHLLGFKKLVEIPGCRSAEIHINACRGYCMTYSFPSDIHTLFLSGGNHVLTSHGSCCTIKTTHDIHFTLECENNQVYQDVIKSASRCECSLCDVEYWKEHLHFSLKKEGKSIPYQRKFRQSSLTEKESSSLTFVSQFVDKEFIKFKGR